MNHMNIMVCLCVTDPWRILCICHERQF